MTGDVALLLFIIVLVGWTVVILRHNARHETPEDVDAAYRAAVERESGYDGLFGAHWDGDVAEREHLREDFGRYWRERREAAERQ